MTLRTLSIALSAWALTQLAGGCAVTPTPDAFATQPVAALDCTQLGDQMLAQQQAQRVAADRQREAWKAVLPFAVAGRYAGAASAAAEAEQRIGELQRELDRQGCGAQGH